MRPLLLLLVLLALLLPSAAAQSAASSASASTTSSASSASVSSSSAAETCAAEAATLSDSCGDVCATYHPCLAYNASASCSSCSASNTSTGCQYACFEAEYENAYGSPGSTFFVLLVTFGDYQSAEELAARAEDPDYDTNLAQLPDNTTDYAWVSNNLLTQVDALELSSEAAYLCVRACLANLTLVADQRTHLPSLCNG
jgi:hypothetical protein